MKPARPIHCPLLVAPFAVLLALGLLLSGCDVKKKDTVQSGSSARASSQSAAGQAQERADAAVQRLQDAQQNATTDQEKIDAYNRYEKERREMAEGNQGNTGSDQNPPPN